MAHICTTQHAGRVRNAVKEVEAFSQAEENGRHRCAACAFEAGAQRVAEVVRNELAKFIDEQYAGNEKMGNIVFTGASQRLDALLHSVIKSPVTMSIQTPESGGQTG